MAGERFLRGLIEGRILASQCSNCGKRYIPPKAYCVDCFLEIKRFTQLGSLGLVAAITESSVGFGGDRLAKPKTFVFVVYKGVTGGLIHYAIGPRPEIGSKVVPKFRAPKKRKGTILDIKGFVRV